jgi:hypothetical protein
MKRAIVLVGLVFAASLAGHPAVSAGKEKRHVLPPVIPVLKPYDDDGTSDSRKDVPEVTRPLPPSGPSIPIPYCGPSAPQCP